MQKLLTTTLFVLTLLLGFQLARAFEYNVTRFDDPVPPVFPFCVPGDCSLREAVMQASQTHIIMADAHIINLLPGKYTLSIPSSGDPDDGKTGDLDILNHSLTIKGAGADKTTIDATGLGDRIFDIPRDNGINVVLSGMTLKGGDPRTTSKKGGGAISDIGTLPGGSSQSLTIQDCLITENYAQWGGAIYSENQAIIINNSTLYKNTSATVGGGIFSNAGPIKINNSTISDNTAGFRGGAVNFVSVGITTILMIRNSTIFDNKVTITKGGGLSLDYAAVLDIANSILAGNIAPAEPDCVKFGSGNIYSLGFNLFGDIGSCAATGYIPLASDKSGIATGDLGLAPLGNYGGPTPTHLLISGSQAIDGGNPAGCKDTEGTVLVADQRGFFRPVDGDGVDGARCDIGAVEFGRCGDGKINQLSEQCDDGGTANQDGCSSLCLNESGGGGSGAGANTDTDTGTDSADGNQGNGSSGESTRGCDLVATGSMGAARGVMIVFLVLASSYYFGRKRS